MKNKDLMKILEQQKKGLGQLMKIKLEEEQSGLCDLT